MEEPQSVVFAMSLWFFLFIGGFLMNQIQDKPDTYKVIAYINMPQELYGRHTIQYDIANKAPLHVHSLLLNLEIINSSSQKSRIINKTKIPKLYHVVALLKSDCGAFKDPSNHQFSARMSSQSSGGINVMDELRASLRMVH